MTSHAHQHNDQADLYADDPLAKEEWTLSTRWMLTKNSNEH